MGIPRLKQHLLSFCQPVLFQGATNYDEADLECISSVVIDGPSLVYNVYSRLLSWFSVAGPSRFDVLPTCDEVSQGVMLYLAHLKMLGVKIENIYFDGALPARKHATRVGRLENQRRKLELFCAETKNGFEPIISTGYKRTVRPENVLRSRPTPTMYSNIPANPFMVSAVFEDLKCRWTGANIIRATKNTLPLQLFDHESLPWADLSIMVPGEADAYCAYTAKFMGCCILTNDSDLVLYDLGNHGSVAFLDSVELTRREPSKPLMSRIRAAILRPSIVTQRLGVSNLLPLAYELKIQPEIGFGELLRRSKNTTFIAELTNYRQFVEEYQSEHCCIKTQPTGQSIGMLDTRVSELLWQYELRGEYATRDCPYVYLATMSEDHTKRCAWAKGREYRKVAYSILNVSRPTSERYPYVIEFTRRGQRIAEEEIQLRDEIWISAQIKSLQTRLQDLQTSIGKDSGSLHFWTLFAVRDSYGLDSGIDEGDFQKLKQFLRVGYMGKRLGWADIHLSAQIYSVLYSLRVLKQLLELSNSMAMVSMELRAILKGLPPLHIIMDPAQHRTELCSDITITQLSDMFGPLAQNIQPQCPENANKPAKYKLQTSPSVASTAQNDTGRPVHSLKTMSNLYELLQEQ